MGLEAPVPHQGRACMNNMRGTVHLEKKGIHPPQAPDMCEMRPFLGRVLGPVEAHAIRRPWAAYVDGLEAKDDRRMPPAWQRRTHAQHRAGKAGKALLPSSYCDSSPQEAAAGGVCKLLLDARGTRLAGAGAGVAGRQCPVCTRGLRQDNSTNQRPSKQQQQ